MSETITKFGASVTGLQVSTEPCKLSKITGNWRGTADVYLQIHDTYASAALSGGSAVPLWSELVYAGTSFSFDLPRLSLRKGCYLSFSTTAQVWNVVTGAGVVGDLYADGEGFLTDATTKTVDTDVDTLALATSARMVRVFVETVSGDCHALIYRNESGEIDTGQAPYVQKEMLSGESHEFAFGEGIDAPLTGFLVQLSSTANKFLASGETAAKILAYTVLAPV